MAHIYGLVGYHPTGLPTPTLLSVTRIEATVEAVAFGDHTTREQTASGISLSEQRAHAWLQRERDRLQSGWNHESAEPSFAADFTISRLATLETPLFDVDDTLTPAAVYAAFARALAERAGVRLPPLADSVVIVGSIAADGMLSHRPYALSEIVRAASGIIDRTTVDKPPTRYLIGPFFGYDPEVASGLKELSMTIQPIRTLDELLRVVLDGHSEQILRSAFEQLALFDRRTQGEEAQNWQAAEDRWAQHPQSYERYVAKVKKRRLKSTVLQHAIDAAETLVVLRNGTDREASHRLSTELVRKGHLLTAIWLLVRRSFLLRERREAEAADQCLMMAQSLQRRVPLAVDLTMLLHQLGRSYYFQARFVEGLKLYWQGYQLLSADARDDVPGADFYNSAGKCLNDLYQLSLALGLFEWARSIYERRGQVGKLLFNTGSQAEAYWRIGAFAQAKELYGENLAHATDAEQGQSEQPNIMRGKNSVALTLLAQGNLPEADQLYTETVAYYYQRATKSRVSSKEDDYKRELGNLMFSVAGLAQVNAAQGKWEQVGTLVATHFAEAEREIDPQIDTACLAVALLAFVNAQRLQRAGDQENATQWLKKASSFLSYFYPMEHAMMDLEQLLFLITAPANTQKPNHNDYLKILQQAKDEVTTFLDAESEVVSQQFALLRDRLERGLAEGKQLYEREKRRRAELDANFVAAADHLRAHRVSAAVVSLRAIQTFVPYFRDLIKQLKLQD